MGAATPSSLLAPVTHGTGDSVPPEATSNKRQIQLKMIPSSQVRLGGRLRFFQHHWALLTKDAWVLSTIQGFQLEFWEPPRETYIPKPLSFSQPEMSLIDKEIRDLLTKGAISQSSFLPGGFVSTVFLVQKRGGGHRLVLNLKE